MVSKQIRSGFAMYTDSCKIEALYLECGIVCYSRKLDFVGKDSRNFLGFIIDFSPTLIVMATLLARGRVKSNLKIKH